MSESQKEKMISSLRAMSTEELALVMATGLNCQNCPVAQEVGKCYDKVVYYKNMLTWLKKEGD